MKKIILFYSALTVLLPFTSHAGSLTISGISSGGFMASQMAVIYSDQFSGVATVAGGVFYCAQDTYQNNLNQYGNMSFFSYGVSSDILQSGTEFFNITPAKVAAPNLTQAIQPTSSNPLYQAMSICMDHPATILGSEIQSDGSSGPMKLDFLTAMQNNNQIAPIANIAQQRVLIYQGNSDRVVQPAMAGKLQEFYKRLGVADSAMKVILADGGAHNFPTDRTDGIACDSETVPFIANCQRDLAGDILQHLLNRGLSRVTAVASHLYSVKQVDAPNSIAPSGYLYANDFCLNNPTQCDLHVALHGCEMSDSYDDNFEKLYESKVQMTEVLQVQDYEMTVRTPRMGALLFAQRSGYAEYAEDPANHVMILFPQTQIIDANYPGNPKGCWDWYGWTGSSYATSQGAESSWLIKEIQQVWQNPSGLILKN